MRPHPEFSFHRILRDLMGPAEPPFYTLSSHSLAEDLAWADAVVYVSSTVGVEALSMGLPVIHLELGELLSTDPLFGWRDLKWSVAEPDRFIETLREISMVPQERFAALQAAARGYAGRYLRPATAERIQQFVEV